MPLVAAFRATAGGSRWWSFPQVTTEADVLDPLADPEVGFVTPTQAGDLVTPPQDAPQPTHHQGGAHQVPFSLDDAPSGLEAVHIHFNDLGEPYDPAAEVGIPVPTLQPVDPSSLHNRFGDSASSDGDATMDEDLSFVKGSATHGDVHNFVSFVAAARQHTCCRTNCRHGRLGATKPPTAQYRLPSPAVSASLQMGGDWSLADGVLQMLTQLSRRTQWFTLQDYLLCSRPLSPCL